MGSRINVLRRKVSLGQYELTSHAKEEMEQDGFSIVDVKAAIYSGKVVSIQRHGRARQKYLVKGQASDERSVRLVCRLTSTGGLRIITVYAE